MNDCIGIFIIEKRICEKCGNEPYIYINNEKKLLWIRGFMLIEIIKYIKENVLKFIQNIIKIKWII